MNQTLHLFLSDTFDPQLTYCVKMSLIGFQNYRLIIMRSLQTFFIWAITWHDIQKFSINLPEFTQFVQLIKWQNYSFNQLISNETLHIQQNSKPWGKIKIFQIAEINSWFEYIRKDCLVKNVEDHVNLDRLKNLVILTVCTYFDKALTHTFNLGTMG